MWIFREKDISHHHHTFNSSDIIIHNTLIINNNNNKSIIPYFVRREFQYSIIRQPSLHTKKKKKQKNELTNSKHKSL